MRGGILTVVHLGAVVLLAYMDLLAGPEVELRPLYLLPVLSAALTAGRLPALATGAAAALAVLLVVDFDSGRASLSPLTLALGAVRLATFEAVAILVARTREQRHALRREARAREEYTDLVAHEVRNPLVGIKAAATVLSRESEGPDLVQRVRRTGAGIAAEATAGIALLDDLREVSHIEARALHVALRPLDLAEVAQTTAAAFTDLDHEIDLRAASPVLVLGDAGRLAQVLRNLLTNAAKYSPSGTPIEVTAGVSADRRSGVIAVSDHGPGIPPRERADLFMKFKRLSTAGGTQGSGLGLYISRAIVRAHRGELGVEQSPGGGAIFTLTIPLAEASAPKQ